MGGGGLAVLPVDDAFSDEPQYYISVRLESRILKISYINDSPAVQTQNAVAKLRVSQKPLYKEIPDESLIYLHTSSKGGGNRTILL